MWTNKRETNLLTLLNIFKLIAKIFKYFLATSELLQFKHLNKAQTNDDDVDFSKDIDKERLIIKNKTFLKMHEILSLQTTFKDKSHNNFSEINKKW
jgi:hypothetical protein